MWTGAQLGTELQTLFTTTAPILARETGFVQRASKLTGAAFVQSLLFGWLNNPQATLQQLAQMAGTVGVPISPPAVEQRFTPPAAQFLQRMVEVAPGSVVRSDPVAIPLVHRFAGISLRDALSQGAAG